MDLETYQRAFESVNCPMALDLIAQGQDELPEALKDALNGVASEEDFIAFHFSRYVPEFRDTVRCWIPIRKTEAEEFTPEEMAIMTTPFLTQAQEHAIQRRRARTEATGEEGTNDAASAHNSG